MYKASVSQRRNSDVVPGRLELPTSTLSVWRSNQLSYRTVVLRLRDGSVQDLGINKKPGFLFLANIIKKTEGERYKKQDRLP